MAPQEASRIFFNRVEPGRATLARAFPFVFFCDSALALPFTCFAVKNMHVKQMGMGVTDVQTDRFEVRRGTEQGNPLSSPSFNPVLQHAMERNRKVRRT